MSQVNIQGGRVQGISVLETLKTGVVRMFGRNTGLRTLSKRFELLWIAGIYGIPSINADILSATEATNITADRDFEIVGGNATTDDASHYAEGGITMTTSGADGDEIILAPHLDANQTAWEKTTWGTDKEVEWEAHIQMGGSVASCAVWAGLKLTNIDLVATDDDQAFFRYESGLNGARWEAVWSIAGTDVKTDTGSAAVLLDDIYHLKITIDSDRIARFYIDSKLVATTTALTDTKDRKPYIGVGERGASAAKVVRIFGQAISRVVG